MAKGRSRDIHALAQAKGWVASKEPFQVEVFPRLVLKHTPPLVNNKGWLDVPFYLSKIQPRKFLAPVQIPRMIDWREEADLAPPWDQRPSNMCMAHAFCATADARSLLSPGPAFRFAPRYFHCFFMGLDPALGASIDNVSDAAIEYGLPHAFPGEETITTVAECEDLAQPSRSKVKGVFSFATIQEVKQEIFLRGPVLCVLTVYSDFLKNYGSGIYRITAKDNPTEHGMTIVGYNDDEDFWIIKNSYGPNWGDLGGYCLYSMEDSGLLTNNPEVWAMDL